MRHPKRKRIRKKHAKARVRRWMRDFAEGLINEAVQRLLTRLVCPGAVDGDRGAGDLVGRGVTRAEEIVSPALGIEGAHADAVDLGAPVVSGLGIAAEEEGAGEDE